MAEQFGIVGFSDLSETIQMEHSHKRIEPRVSKKLRQNRLCESINVKYFEAITFPGYDVLRQGVLHNLVQL